MGLMYKLLVPRPVKRVRRTVTRATHPVRTVRRAVTPKPVKVAAHPVRYTKGAIENQIVRSLKGQSRRNGTRAAAPAKARSSAPSGLPAIALLPRIIGQLFVGVLCLSFAGGGGRGPHPNRTSRNHHCAGRGRVPRLAHMEQSTNAGRHRQAAIDNAALARNRGTNVIAATNPPRRTYPWRQHLPVLITTVGWSTPGGRATREPAWCG